MNSPNNHITHTAMRYYCSRPYINHDTPPGCSSSMYLRRNSQPNGTAERHGETVRETLTERSGQPYGAQIYSEIIEQPYVNYSNNYYKQTLENSGDIYKTPYNFAEELEKSGIIERTANTQEDYVAEIREMLTDKDTREQLKELIRETEGRRTQSDDEEERRRRRKHRHKRRRKRSSSSANEEETRNDNAEEREPQTENGENDTRSARRNSDDTPEKFTKITVEHEALPVKIIPLNIPRNDGEQSPRSVSPRSPKSPRNDKPEKKKKGLKLRKKNKIKND